MEISILLLIALVVILGFVFSRESGSVRYRIRGPLLSPAERSFYGELQQVLTREQTIVAKVRIADVVLPQKGMSKSKWQSAFNKVAMKHFDFVLCNKNDFKVLAVIELDDKSHQSKKARRKDAFINGVCMSAGLPIIRIQAKKSYQLQEIRAQLHSALNPQLP